MGSGARCSSSPGPRRRWTCSPPSARPMPGRSTASTAPPPRRRGSASWTTITPAPAPSSFSAPRGRAAWASTSSPPTKVAQTSGARALTGKRDQRGPPPPKVAGGFPRSASPQAFASAACTACTSLPWFSAVVVFDVNWNPSFDAQAQDRAYRIGQSRDVTVYRFVCQGTIEERMYMRQLHKTRQTSEILDGKRAARQRRAPRPPGDPNPRDLPGLAGSPLLLPGRCSCRGGASVS